MLEDLTNLISNQIKTNRSVKEEEKRKKQEILELKSQYILRDLSQLSNNIEIEIKKSINQNENHAWKDIDKEVYSILCGRTDSLPNGSKIVNPFERIVRDFAKVGIDLSLSETDTSFEIEGVYCEHISRYLSAKWRKI